MPESRRKPTRSDASNGPAPGTSAPLGATPAPAGANFSVFSRHATGVELLLFDRVDDPRPSRVIRIDPATSRTYHYWHVFVPGVRPGQMYGYRAYGRSGPGMRFDPAKVLLDPYGRGVAVPLTYSREAAAREGDNAATAMKSVVVDTSAYDWEGDAPLRRHSSRTIVYEMHVRGFTRHPSSGVAERTRGTFRGLIEKVPYLQQLGITAVELLPVFQFDAQDCPPGRVNYWGYHDGKHNRANGEDNRDGADDNRSWNCGVEGPTDDPALEALRNRQVKNFLTVTLLSLGVPMILMGDEVRRTQGGNNNAYCLDDETSWFDWGLLARHADVLRFVTLLDARRTMRDVEHEERRVSLTELIRQANKAWHGVKLHEPDWGDDSHSLAFAAELQPDRLSVYLILNAYWEPLDFELPPVGDGDARSWRRWIDTSLASPQDIVPWREAPSLSGPTYRAGARSVVVLFAEAFDSAGGTTMMK